MSGAMVGGEGNGSEGRGAERGTERERGEMIDMGVSRSAHALLWPRAERTSYNSHGVVPSPTALS